MKLLINTSNIVIGGGLQVSLSIIETLKKHPDNEYNIFVSPQVNRQLNTDDYPANFKFFLIENSPANLRKRRKTLKILFELERTILPDLVFTVFGPSYWNPKSLHITGFANGWCYTPDSIAFKKLSYLQLRKSKLLIFFKNRFIKKADYIIVETETAKQNIYKNLNYPLKNIFVVGNTFHPSFLETEVLEKRKESDVFKLLVLSGFYPNKNLKIINEVVVELQNKFKLKFKFILTLNDNTFKTNFIDSKYIENIGPQNIIDCKELYQKIDALFLPTLLETFSANYLEAMVMKVPILTSDLDFARELCGNAALYFNPLSPKDIAEKILELQENENLQEELIRNGELKLEQFETPESRTSKYLLIFKEIIINKK
ncbi:glycosyltransferase [Bizionia saleffrena]|uniref:glycosyltransferase n=1 Tax=Bizionia saleffrena TaxID=291189 RepID=UPI00147843FD|nr:glycosyltransferase [Bizionia saleffrena]